MATFGPIASASPNILFDPARVDAQVQGFQRNQLLMQNAQQDQQQQTYARDTEARIGLARQLVGMPEDQAAAVWGQERQRLQAAGFGRDLPEQFPGLERLKSVAASDLTTFQRLQIDEKRRQSEALAGLFGGLPAAGGASMGGATPGYTPASMSSPLPTVTAQPATGGAPVRAQNANYAQMRQEAMDTLEGDALARRLAEISAAASADLTGTPAGTQYRANPGSTGAFAGMPAPAAGVPVLGGGQAAATPASSGGLTPDQRRLLAVTAQTNPGAVPALMMQLNQQGAMAQERALDNDRAERQMRAQQAQQEEANRRANETAQRQADVAQRAAEAAERAARNAGLQNGYRWVDENDHSKGQTFIPGGPHDPAAKPEKFTEGQANAALYADRMIQAEAVMDANPTGGQSWRDRIAGSIPGVGGYLVSDEYQQIEQAQRNFINAVLRRESGAAIAASEFESARRQYFPEPSDTPERLEQKRQTRMAAINGIARAAGPAYERPPPAVSGEGGNRSAGASGGAGTAPARTTPPPPPGFRVIQ